MKDNHEIVLQLISKAIIECKEDAMLAQARQLLRSAMQCVEKVSKKRNSRHKQLKFFEEEAKKKQEKWMDLLKKNIKLTGDLSGQDQTDRTAEW